MTIMDMINTLFYEVSCANEMSECLSEVVTIAWAMRYAFFLAFYQSSKVDIMRKAPRHNDNSFIPSNFGLPCPGGRIASSYPIRKAEPALWRCWR